MHNYTVRTYHNLPFSFEQLWMGDHLPNREMLRPSNPCSPFCLNQRLPMFSLPQLWNEEAAIENSTFLSNV
jgi:hypothetical protein